MEKLYGNAVVGQSGGPTAAINATLSGVIRGALAAIEKGSIGKLYGMRNGIEGFCEERLVDLGKIFTTEQRLRGPIKTLAALRRSCDAFDGGRLEIVRAEGDILHYRRVGVVQTAEIILNRGPHLIAEEAFGKNTEVNPGGFTVLVEDNHPEHVGYFSVY